MPATAVSKKNAESLFFIGGFHTGLRHCFGDAGNGGGDRAGRVAEADPNL